MSFVAGVLNALAGGGTFMVFPTLLFAGLDPISANASSSVILVPGGTASAWVYRRDLPIRGPMLYALLAVCIVGGGIGSQLLLMTPSQRFARAVPYLMIAAAAVYTFSRQLTRLSARYMGGRLHMGLLLVLQFAIAVYGGYFGAGMGVVMIVMFQLAAHLSVQQSAGLRIMCAITINTLAIPNFILRGVVDWRVAIPMLLCAVAGGYWGAHAVQRLSPEAARRAVLFYAWATGIWLLVR
jgi:uncharacterized membrane protein YfcA